MDFNNLAPMESLNLFNHGFQPQVVDEMRRSIDPMFEHHMIWNNMNMNMAHEPNKKHHQLQGYAGKKRKKGSEEEVVHVRAKRGQATDSHSLAERLRREKINDKLRCLQDLVPGCYKTMGMAVMLDVIINYVRSLQNQIDFLSMKLSAASLYYDFNSSDAEAMETVQQVMNGYEAAQMVEKFVGEGFSHL